METGRKLAELNRLDCDDIRPKKRNTVTNIFILEMVTHDAARDRSKSPLILKELMTSKVELRQESRRIHPRVRIPIA